MKIRIGNDIRLKLKLKFTRDSEKSVNIKSVKALFINTTLKSKFDKTYINKNRFVGRFPIEPFLYEFEPTAYAVNSGGFPNYHAFVRNQYAGFGLFPKWNKCFPHKLENITEYLAECKHTADVDTITTIFPAEAQLYPGVYKLVLVAKVYAPGYKNNVRTITVDYCNIFELVCSSCEEGVDKAVTIDLDLNPEEQEDPDENSNDIYIVDGRYSTNNLSLIRNDGENVDITIDSWYEED